ncbi:ubiquinone/menaquinone biosynthesis C-methylase UbiE [Chryseobacterium sp. SORGH_AS 447]|uniref:class I SAM-dependent methyltransferase n=1 Tax=Chryseobacterium sp. SORGH_AS_0447 TaxID=3041769 RepID=UPI002783FA5E|nr:class I SAM-dependent methyltransferase [Chryseobacterium sp. SORGH_AS_0447]MDQ1162771.1 ubiquinone/menaquinone biosynthesis C-methylase UbiE [Chryseobacterium sp. SORGH_AS_0447]
MDQEKLKILAQNLANPEGEKGIEIGEMMNATNIGMTLESIKALLIEDSEHILEIGHGNAGHVKSILNRAQNIKYTGIDISATMHNEAKRLNEAFRDQADFVLYDGEKLPFEDNTFDKIFTVNTVYFWKQPVDYLNEVYRVLKKTGIFILTFAQKDFMEKLPFTQFDFTLYNTDEMEETVSGSYFSRMTVSERGEEVKSKTGDETITRNYTILTIKK